MRRVALAAVAALLAAVPAGAAELKVALDQSARLNIQGAAASVIVGNPKIADVTVVDERTVFVSGKGYGLTDLTILDRRGKTLWRGDVAVTAPASGQVSVWRGAKATDMACGTVCTALPEAAAAK